ncbi:MAG: tRNA (guanosine(37)-N1)-methyltransferase TrmD [Patescibacteria group bacterium]
MKFNIITIFPDSLKSYLSSSLLGKAQKNKLIKINLINLRRFATDKHKSVDGKPFGGGPGMVLKIEPVYKAVNSILKKKDRKKTRVILFSTRGKKFDGKDARRLSRYKDIVFICGRYEGVDERVADYIADEEISIGDYVLEGGELPALVLIDSISRHIPGVLGKIESLEEIKGSYVGYTRPDIFVTKEGNKLKVPQVLLSGNHKRIAEWREKKD